MTYKTIDWKVREDICYLTLAAPPKNEMDSVFFEEFSQIISSLDRIKNIKGLIIQAKGRHFSSGANIDQLLSIFSENKTEIPEPLARNVESFKMLSKLNFPVVACIKKICFGSGLELALSAHFRISTTSLLMSLPETGFGIIPGLGGGINTQKQIGTARSLEFILSGKSITANEAIENGMIDFIVDKNDLEETAQSIIEKVSKNYRKELKAKYLRELKTIVIE